MGALPALAAPDRSAPPRPDNELPDAAEEIHSLRTAKSKTYKTSEPGRMRTKSAASPIHYKTAEGDWADIESRWNRTANGALRNGANSFTVDLAEHAGGPALATVAFDAGHSIAFGLQGAAASPVGKQRGDQARAGYAGVMADVDLEFTLQSEGVKEDIVLHRSSAPDTYVFPLKLQGLTAALTDEGDVVYTDESGVQRAVTPRGVMSDSSTDVGGFGVTGAVRYELVDNGTALKVVADRAWLDDPARVYPVRIDPTLKVGPDRMETYRNGCTYTIIDSDLRVGNAMACGNSNWRTVAHFDYDSLYGKKLTAASVHLTALTGGGTVNGYNTSVSLATQWGWSCKGTDSVAVATGETEQHTPHNDDGRIFAIYNTAITNRVGHYSLCFVGTETSGLYTYKHFSTVQLWLDWTDPNQAPYTPDSRQPLGGAKVAYPVTLSARYLDPNTSDNGNLYFEVVGGPTSGGVATTDGQRGSWGPLTSVGQGTWQWRVRAWDGALYSAWSTYLSVTVVKPPGAPTSVSATDGEESAEVDWTPNTNNGGETVDYFAVDTYNGAGALAVPRKIVTCSAPCTAPMSTTITGLQKGMPYYFRVSGHNPTAGYGAYTQSNTITTPKPASAPTELTATAKYASAELNWKAPTNMGGRALVDYEVEVTDVTTSSNPPTTRRCEDACTADNQTTVTGLVPGNAYKFRVRAITTYREPGAWSLYSNDTVVEPTLTEAPNNVRATRLDKAARVVWTPPLVAVPGLTQYEVKAHRVDRATGDVTGTTTAPPVVTDRYDFEGLNNGDLYYFTVTSMNVTVRSEPSLRSNVVNPAGAPFAPTGVAVERGDQSATVSWTGVDDNGEPVTSFTVSAYDADGNLVESKPAGNEPVVMGGLTNGRTYSFAVSATNPAGTGPQSSRVSVVPAGVPAAPTGVSAVGRDAAADLAWTAPSGNGSAITKYLITVEPGGRTYITSNPDPATTVAATNGWNQSFTVAAVNDVGTGPASAASNTVRPKGKPGVPTNVLTVDGDSVPDDRYPGNPNSIQVAWDASEPNGTVISHYIATARGAPPLSGHLPTLTERVEASDPLMMATFVEQLVPGADYHFTVEAFTADSQRSGESEAVITFPAEVGLHVPSTPSITSVTGGESETATVNWTGSQDGDRSVNGYRASAYSASGGPTQSVRVDANARTARIPNLTAGPYTFSVVALSEAGESDLSPLKGSGGIKPAKVAGLGDSYSSGEGNLEWEEGTGTEGGNKCHRSERRAYPEYFRTRLATDLLFQACSAAQTEHIRSDQQVEGPPAETKDGQWTVLRDDTSNMVVLSIGGNDAGFGDVIKTCLGIPPHTDVEDGDCTDNGVDQDIRDLKPILIETYRDVARKEAPRKADIFVLEYPNPFTNENRVSGCTDDGGPALLDSERDFLIDMGELMNQTIREAAAESGVRVTPVPVHHTFAGHEVCTADPWFWGLNDQTTWSFHPRAEGQFAMAASLAAQATLIQPSVDSVSLHQSVASPSVCSGGETVTIRGLNFALDAEVWFGGVKSPSVQYVTSTELRAVVPAGAVGRADVQVRTNRGQYWGASAPVPGATFTYVADTVDPVANLAKTPAANADGWHQDGTRVTLTATDQTCPGDVVSITYEATAYDGGTSIPRTTVQGSSASFDVAKKGITEVTYWATDSSGNTSVRKHHSVGIDQAVPESFIDAAEQQTYAAGAPVIGGASDNLSGIKEVTVRFTDNVSGASAERTADCTSGCGTRSARWSVSTASLAPGTYIVRSQAKDLAGLTGPLSWPITAVVVDQ